MSKITAFIEIPHLRVQNANAVSGSLSWGFPAPSAIVGFAHALERKLGNVRFGGVGVICHRFEPQINRNGRFDDYTFRLMRSPAWKSWRSVRKESATVEEGRVHLEITLLIELLLDEPLVKGEDKSIEDEVRESVSGMRFAGGTLHQAIWIGDTLLHRESPKVAIHEWPETEDEARKRFYHTRYHWLPGFVLVERQGLLRDHLKTLRKENPKTDALEAMLDLLALHNEPEVSEIDDSEIDPPVETANKKPEKAKWTSKKRYRGWLVPVPVGFGGLSELYEPGCVTNVRDATVPFRFVESLYSVGQWISPHRLTSLQQLLWHTEFDAEQGLYLCRNNYSQEDHSHDQ